MQVSSSKLIVMKKFFQLFTSLFLFCASYSWSQSTIRGIVKDETGKAFFAATVSLLQASDSVTVKFALTDKDGRYYFSAVSHGKYFIAAFAVGHDTAYSSAFVPDTEG